MDSAERVTDDAAWHLATAYIDAWNRRDRGAWLELLHSELEFHPTALVGTGIVYRGMEGAGRYFDELIASGREERARIVGMRRIAADRFLIELELMVGGNSMGSACFTAQVRDGKFVDTRGYLSDARTLATVRVIPADAPPLSQPNPPAAV